MKKGKLTERQKRFIDFYIETGDKTKAARLAGYRQPESQGYQNYEKLRKIIDQKIDALDKNRIAKGDEILQFLTSVMRGEVTEQIPIYCVRGIQKLTDKNPGIRDRVEAAKQLGKRYGLEQSEPPSADETGYALRQYGAAWGSFWEYCRLKMPNFYTDDALYLREVCEALQAFETDENELLVLNIPPRHGKTLTVGHVAQWYLGRNPSLKMIVTSYNTKLSRQISKTVRDSIGEVKADAERAVFSDIFPDVRIERGAAQADLWKLEGSPVNNYLASSPKATITGFGGEIAIIDDLVKNAYEANYAAHLEEHFTWFTDTFYSRLEGKAKIILVMTRWATKDLAGRVISMYREQGRKIRVITKKAFDGAKMLNPAILDKARYDNLIQTVGEDIVAANYNQEPIDLKGRLYGTFTTYTEKPNFARIEAYCDTADKGKDYLCNVIFGVVGGKAPDFYVLDVLYTQADMDATEREIVKRLIDFDVERMTLESNFGGTGWKKVLAGLYAKAGGEKCAFKVFAQTANKEARILAGASTVTRKIIMPDLWDKRFPLFYQHVTEYQRIGTNQQDDAPDVLTLICERAGKQRGFLGVNYS